MRGLPVLQVSDKLLAHGQRGFGMRTAVRLAFGQIVLAAVMVLLSATPAAAVQSMPSSGFQPVEQCGCHAGMVSTWSQSMHAKALSDPLYKMKLAEADKATNGLLGPFCNGCHGPVAVMSGELKGTDQSKMSAVGAEAISCDYCHQLVGHGKIADADQVVNPDGTKRAQLRDATSAPHVTAYSAYHESAEFCGTCHNVDHPLNGVHLEATYTEWKEGPYAARGIVCQDCHMTPGPGKTYPVPGKAAAGGPVRPHIYSMTWAGGNVGLGDAWLAKRRLEGAAKLELEAPEIVNDGSTGDVVVTITNIAAGHYLPTGLTEFRQMWLEVTATDSSGKEVLNKRRDFVTQLQDAKGNHPVELWDAVAIYSDDRIPPLGSAVSTYALSVPSDGPVTVKAALKYRSATEEAAKKAGVEIPTTLMASAQRTVFASEDQQRTYGQKKAQAAAARISGGDGMTLAIALGAFLVIGLTFAFVRVEPSRK